MHDSLDSLISKTELKFTDNLVDKIVPSNTVGLIIDEIASLHQLYHSNVKSAPGTKSLVLKVSDPLVSTMKEHHRIENRLFKEHGINMVSIYPTTESMEPLRFDETSKKLFFNDFEVSVVYIRHGYDIQHFTFNGSEMGKLALWSGKSMAINFPSVRTQLLGVKHFQKFLMMPEFLIQIGMTLKDVETICYHSKEMRHIGIDFEWDKDKMVAFVESNLEEYEFVLL